jgi:energy-coupling factor transporter transmembrane protein EcfT
LGIILISSIEFNNSIKFNFENSLKGLLYATRLFVTSFIALIIFETTSIYQLENELDKIPLFKKFKISKTISLTILFIPLIFVNWNKIQNAIKARSVKNSKNIFIKINNLFQSFSTLLSYLLNTAENTRKAILNREKHLVK